MATVAKQSTLAAALIAAQSELHAPTKNRTVKVRSEKGNYSFDYATLDSIVESLLRPVLPQHGLWFVQGVRDGQMVTTIVHASGETMECGVPMPPMPPKPQDAGSLISYFKRYSLCAAFGLVAEEDDDANVASGNSYEAANRNTKAQNGSDVKHCTDDQRDMIQMIAPAAGKTTQDICTAYRIGSLKELTEAQAAKLIERLQDDAKQPEKTQ